MTGKTRKTRDRAMEQRVLKANNVDLWTSDHRLYIQSLQNFSVITNVV